MLTKTDLVRNIYEMYAGKITVDPKTLKERDLTIDQKTIERVIHALDTVLVDAVKQHARVGIPGVGILRTTVRPARTYRNPRDGSAIEKPSCRRPTVLLNKELRDAIRTAPLDLQD